MWSMIKCKYFDCLDCKMRGTARAAVEAYAMHEFVHLDFIGQSSCIRDSTEHYVNF